MVKLHLDLSYDCHTQPNRPTWTVRAPLPRLLMTEAQLAFDAAAGPLCPSQLTAPVLHTVLALPSLRCHVWGGKGVGSQGDGTAQLLCKSVEDQMKVRSPKVCGKCPFELGTSTVKYIYYTHICECSELELSEVVGRVYSGACGGFGSLTTVVLVLDREYGIH